LAAALSSLAFGAAAASASANGENGRQRQWHQRRHIWLGINGIYTPHTHGSSFGTVPTLPTQFFTFGFLVPSHTLHHTYGFPGFLVPTTLPFHPGSWFPTCLGSWLVLALHTCHTYICTPHHLHHHHLDSWILWIPYTPHSSYTPHIVPTRTHSLGHTVLLSHYLLPCLPPHLVLYTTPCFTGWVTFGLDTGC